MRRKETAVGQALQNKINLYRASKGKDPDMILLNTFHYVQLLEEMGTGAFSVPEHKYHYTVRFDGVLIVADMSRQLGKEEKYSIIEFKKVTI